MDWLQFLQIVCVPAFVWLVYKFGEIRKELSDFKVQVARTSTGLNSKLTI